jgi:hypothetical protein
MTVFQARFRNCSTRSAATGLAPRSGQSIFTFLSLCAHCVSIRSAWRLSTPFRPNAQDQLLRRLQGARTVT